MTLDDLIGTASRGYPDDFLILYHQKPKKNHGDTLAGFIVGELTDTFESEKSDNEQIDAAVAALDRARDELESVCRALLAHRKVAPS